MGKSLIFLTHGVTAGVKWTVPAFCQTTVCTKSVEKQDTKLLPITSSNINRFQTFFTVELGSKVATN